MNWKKHFFYLTILAVSLAACDSFQDDVAPTGEDELVLKSAISALPNTSLFIDLKSVIQTSETVKFMIGQQPAKGTASIDSKAVLFYQPMEEFVSGQDYLTIIMIDQSGNTIDTDGLYINMTLSADSLPCLNGALTDYYTTEPETPIILTPLENDGYCPGETSGAILDFTEEPSNGSIEQVELFTYSYTPNTGFTGVDAFMYELTLIDNDGQEYYSLAQVNVTVELSTPCDTLIQPQSIEVDVWGGAWGDDVVIELFNLDTTACSSLDYLVSIDDVIYGEVVYDEDYPNMIYYTPGNSSVDTVSYTVTFADGHSVSSYVEILIP